LREGNEDVSQDKLVIPASAIGHRGRRLDDRLEPATIIGGLDHVQQL
jgi:hypothetical protein